MALTRRLFLERLAATAGAAMTYEAMAALGLVAVPASPVSAFELRGQAAPGQEVLILGAGLAGMSTAYELGKLGYKCTILEARTRPGGRCHTIRKGTVSEEEGSTQTAAYDEGMYFNPGPMRIPHHHAATLGYAKELGVPIEVFVDDNENAYLHKTGAAGAKDTRFRRREVRADVTGYTSELLAKAVSQPALNAAMTKADVDALVTYLKRNGGLDARAAYAGSTRRGFKTVPGVGAATGELSAPIPLHDLLDSKTALYLQTEYLHGAPMFQIVGGTDRLAAGFAAKVESQIIYGAAVKEIQQTADSVSVVYAVGGETKKISAPYAVCTLPIPVLASLTVADVSPAIKTGLPSVRYAQVGKIGLQFKRRFWEEDDQIFGGISNTDQDISQVIYPSAGYLSQKGMLVGYYQIGAEAGVTGLKPPPDRQALALTQGAAIHPQYKEEFETGFSVSWHRVPWSRGGWAGWSAEGRRTTYAAMVKGDRRMYFAGDHMTYLIGWMNGALESGRSVATAIHARAGQEVRA
ncbi:MAG: flavin monoamine oxidase family protein [Vicinamibacterales bacterium]